MKPKRDVSVGFTGSRSAPTSLAMECLQIVLEKNIDVIMEFHHGDCVGSDAAFFGMMNHLNPSIPSICHPPDDDKYRAWTPSSLVLEPKPYLERNHNIVDAVHLMIAMPAQSHEILRSGTWATIRYAKKKQTDVMLIYPDGQHELVQFGGKLPL